MSVLEGGRPQNGKTKKVDIAPQRDDTSKYEALLSPDEIAAIRTKARLTVEKEIKDKQEAALLAKFTEEERQALDPKEELVPIFLSLAGHSNYIMLDGTQYFHETLYHVKPSVFQVLTEQMNRGWAHEDETGVQDVRSRHRFRPPVGLNFVNYQDNRRPRDIVTSSAQLAGASPAALGIGVS
jgi:hypothetical protein